jgi:hypothetical protein
MREGEVKEKRRKKSKKEVKEEKEEEKVIPRTKSIFCRKHS